MKKAIFIIGIIMVLGIVAFLSVDRAEGIEATMYKSVNCGCCVGHAAYLEGKGYDVNKVELQDVSGIKTEHDIPLGMQSCHTAVIGDYFVEGHVPIEVIERLLEEKPNIQGIALPRMPSGSPGMPGAKRGDFVIYALDMEGNWNEWMRI